MCQEFRKLLSNISMYGHQVQCYINGNDSCIVVDEVHRFALVFPGIPDKFDHVKSYVLFWLFIVTYVHRM